MTKALIQIVVNGLALMLAAHLVPGIEYEGGPLYLLVAGLVIGLLNLFVKPLAILFSLPFIVVTLGLFFLVINGAMLWLAGGLLDGLTVHGCMPAIFGGLVMALVNWFFRAFDSE